MTRCDAPAYWFCSAVCADEGRTAALRPGQTAAPMSPLILKRAPSGDNQDDYDALETASSTASSCRPQRRRDDNGCGRAGTEPTASPRSARLRGYARGCDGCGVCVC